MSSRSGLWWLVLGLFVQSCPGLAQETAASERQRIQRERRAVEVRHQDELAACAQRFAVNACRDEARSRRREALAPLREQELILSDRERKQRAAARALDIERNRLAADARSLSPPPVASAVRGRAPVLPASAVPLSVPDKGAGVPGAATPSAAQKAARRASEAAQRQREAQADRERIRSRVTTREAAGKKAAPLPPPESKP